MHTKRHGEAPRSFLGDDDRLKTGSSTSMETTQRAMRCIISMSEAGTCTIMEEVVSVAHYCEGS